MSAKPTPGKYENCGLYWASIASLGLGILTVGWTIAAVAWFISNWGG